MQKNKSWGLIISLIVISSGCAHLASTDMSSYFEAGGTVAECAHFFTGLDRLVDKAGVRDVQAVPVAHYPYLRVNRFLSSLREGLNNQSQVQFWLDQLQHLDGQARRIELDNLPASYKSKASITTSDKQVTLTRLNYCAGVLREYDVQVQLDDIRDKAIVPDSYSDVQRIVGLYPLSRWFVKIGIDKLHEETHQTFNQRLEEHSIDGEVIRYQPPVVHHNVSFATVAKIIQQASQNPLAFPLLSDKERETLFAKYAPIWEIDTVSDDDRLGTPAWHEKKGLVVDTTMPRVYRHLSYIRFQDQNLLQLNYVVWFPARPLTSSFDFLGGHLDGITWRVTLDADGHPLLFDVMHNCGCYHMLFPTQQLKLKTSSTYVAEPLLIPTLAPVLTDKDKIILRIAHTTHYLQNIRLTAELKQAQTYMFDDYVKLRSLPASSGGQQSMFSRNGIVAGTSRKERWLLWPMGVADPGAMRQWGHHAIVFIGKRHFDDPDLIERYFTLINSRE